MKKIKACFLLFFLICFLSVTYQYSSASEAVESKNIISVEMTDILYSELGEEMKEFAVELGGDMSTIEENIDNGRAFSLPNINAILIPAGQTNNYKIDICCIDIRNKGQFLFLVESSQDLLNPIKHSKSYVKIYTASGTIITFENMMLSFENGNNVFQEYDDISNTINISTDATLCVILLILGIFVSWPLIIVWALLCL